MSHPNLGLIFPTCPNWIIIAWMTEGEWTKRLSTIHEWVCPFSCSSTEALIICPCWRFAPDWIVLLGTDPCFTFCPFKSSNRKLPVDAKWQIASVYELLSGCPGSLWQRIQWLYRVTLHLIKIDKTTDRATNTKRKRRPYPSPEWMTTGCLKKCRLTGYNHVEYL